MPSVPSSPVTEILRQFQNGEGKHEAADRLFRAVYGELRELARKYLMRERSGHTLQPTGLVHEAYMQLVEQDRVNWRGKTHFYAVAAQAMRRILVDHARRHRAAKRGGSARRIPFDENFLSGPQRNADVLAVDEAIGELEGLDPRQAKMVELRFFGGLNMAEIAQELGMSKRNAEREWTMVRSWLRRELDKHS